MVLVVSSFFVAIVDNGGGGGEGLVNVEVIMGDFHERIAAVVVHFRREIGDEIVAP